MTKYLWAIQSVTIIEYLLRFTNLQQNVIYIRTCPGQSLATLEGKVLLAYLFMNFKFNFDKELIESPYSFFGVISQFEMNFTLDD